MAEEKKPEEKKEQDLTLTPEQIMTMKAEDRQELCMAEINIALARFNCVFNPILILSNHGHQIDIKVVGLAYAAIPTFISFN